MQRKLAPCDADLEEDEDLHNNLKCDQVISDEQTTVDNAKISTLETSIPKKMQK